MVIDNMFPLSTQGVVPIIKTYVEVHKKNILRSLKHIEDPKEIF